MNFKRGISLLVALALCLTLGIGAWAIDEAGLKDDGMPTDEAASKDSGMPSGESASKEGGMPTGSGSSGASAVYDNLPVFESSVYEMPDANAVTATFTVKGYYGSTEATDDEPACTLHAFSGSAAVEVYDESDGRTPAAGVSADFKAGVLTLTFDKAPADETVLYVRFTDGAVESYLSTLYIVSFASIQTYLTDSADYYGFALRYSGAAYTPNAALSAETGYAGTILGGAFDVTGAAHYADEIAAAAEELGYDAETLYNAVDFYLTCGGTTAGDTWEEFVTDRWSDANPTDDVSPIYISDGYTRLEAVYFLFRYLALNSVISDELTGDFVDVMIPMVAWNNYYVTQFQATNPTRRAGGFYQYDSVVDPTGKYAEQMNEDGEFGIDLVVNTGDFLNWIYNAFTGGQAGLTEKGEADAASLLAATEKAGGESRKNNAAAVISVFGMEDIIPDLDAVMDDDVSVWQAVMLYYKLLGDSMGEKYFADEDMELIYGYNTTNVSNNDMSMTTYDPAASGTGYGLTCMGAVVIGADDAGLPVVSFEDSCTIISQEEKDGVTTVVYETLTSDGELAFSYSYDAKSGVLTVEGVDGYPAAFCSGTDTNNADSSAFYCSGLLVKDGVQVYLKNVTVIAQASSQDAAMTVSDNQRFMGGGAGIQVVDIGTQVTIENDDGSVSMISSGSTNVGGMYAGTGASMIVKNSTVDVQSSGHPYSVMYNGTIVFDSATLLNGGGRTFNSDGGSGTLIMNNVVAYETGGGGSVMDETCSYFAVNSYISAKSQWEMNGCAQAIYVNSYIDSFGGPWQFANKTSFTQDCGEVILLNTTVNCEGSAMAASADRGGRGVFACIDSTFTWGGTADSTLFSVKGANDFGSGYLYAKVENSDFPTEFGVFVGQIDTYDSNCLMYLDFDTPVTVSQDCTATSSSSNSMFGISETWTAGGSVVFVIDGTYVYTGVDPDGALYNPALITAATENADGTWDVTWTLSDGSTMTYKSLSYAGQITVGASDVPAADDKDAGVPSGEPLATSGDCEITANGVTGTAHYEEDDSGDGETKGFVITFDGKTIEGDIDKGVWTAASGAATDQAVVDAVQVAFESSNIVGPQS